MFLQATIETHKRGSLREMTLLKAGEKFLPHSDQKLCTLLQFAYIIKQMFVGGCQTVYERLLVGVLKGLFL